MYTHQSFLDNRAQLRSRALFSLIPLSLLLILMLISFILRWSQAITVGLSIAAFGGLVFIYTLFLSPVIVYGRHIDHALHGRTRQTEGTYTCMETSSVLRDGVYFYALTLNVGRPDHAEDDRLFYYDANLPRPDWKSGDRLRLTSYDNRVTAWERIEPEII